MLREDNSEEVSRERKRYIECEFKQFSSHWQIRPHQAYWDLEPFSQRGSPCYPALWVVQSSLSDAEIWDAVLHNAAGKYGHIKLMTCVFEFFYKEWGSYWPHPQTCMISCRYLSISLGFSPPLDWDWRHMRRRTCEMSININIIIVQCNILTLTLTDSSEIFPRQFSMYSSALSLLSSSLSPGGQTDRQTDRQAHNYCILHCCTAPCSQ